MADGVPFGNYRLQRRLARGGMAEVFLARHVGVEGFSRRVAIKRILPHLSDSEEFRVMFLDEAQLAAQLTHPNVVHIYDFGKVEDYYFIAMEFVDGVDLGRLIRQAKQRPVPFQYAARIFADVCSGLHYAHNTTDGLGRPLNLVHRDVTPQNVLITYDGVVKLVDFGIAKAAWQAGRTRPGVVKGKFAYMSPEQVEGRPLDGRSDVFSVGICLYETLTGVPLFRRDDVHASMREIRDGKPIVPEKFRSDVPAELVSIIRRSLATSRDARYPTAAAMQLELEKFLKGIDALGTAHHLGEYLRREHPKTPDADASGGQPALSGSGPGTQQQEPEGTHQQAPPQRRDPTLPPGALTDPIVDDQSSSELAITTPGKAISALEIDDEDAPTTPARHDEEPEASDPTSIHANPARGRQESPRPSPSPNGASKGERRRPAVVDPAAPSTAFDSLRSSRTAVVPPIRGANRRAVVAAAVAALTVMAIGLFILRPWKSQAAPQEPIVVTVPVPVPTPLPVVVPEPRPEPPKPPPVPPALDILSRPPRARVTIDGKLLRAATPIRGERLAPGLHRVAVERKGYLPRELSVQLGDGEHRTLDVELRQAGRQVKTAPSRPSGTLTVRTVPWAKVFDGSRLLGTTPMANVPLSEGAHTLTFVNPDLPPVKKTVTVRVNEETRLNLELKK